LVIGHYQSLADNPGIAPEPDQTCSLQSDQRTLQSQLEAGFALFSPKGIERCMGATSAPRLHSIGEADKPPREYGFT
jgi:hypothetical protein